MAKEKATIAEMVAKVAKEEATWVVEQYKNSTDFKDKVNETICDAYYKGFKECKRKVVQAFHLPDLKDIVADELESIEKKGVIDAQGDATKVDKTAKPEIDLEPSQKP